MTSNYFGQYTVANFLSNPIKYCFTMANALESLFYDENLILRPMNNAKKYLRNISVSVHIKRIIIIKATWSTSKITSLQSNISEIFLSVCISNSNLEHNKNYITQNQISQKYFCQ